MHRRSDLEDIRSCIVAKDKETFPDEFLEYLLDYITRVIEATKNRYKLIRICMVHDNAYTNHIIYEFEYISKSKKTWTFSKELITILNEDDDSQPHNCFRIWIDSLYIYSSRGE